MPGHLTRRRLCTDARYGYTRKRLSIAPSWPPQLGQRRGDRGDGCQPERGHVGVLNEAAQPTPGTDFRVEARARVDFCFCFSYLVSSLQQNI